jgi:hypothetical protein
VALEETNVTDPNLPRWRFYRRVVDEVLPDRSASLLVVCGGVGDKKLLTSASAT